MEVERKGSDRTFMEFGYEFALNVKFEQILLLIYRAYYQENQITDNLNIAKIRPAILEMHNNYSQTMPLKYYAEKCNMSLSSFQLHVTLQLGLNLHAAYFQ